MACVATSPILMARTGTAARSARAASIASCGADPGPARIAHRLMVRRIPPEPIDADDLRKPRSRLDARGMARCARIRLLLVIESGRNLVPDVLVERPTQLDREKLHAAADAE